MHSINISSTRNIGTARRSPYSRHTAALTIAVERSKDLVLNTSRFNSSISTDRSKNVPRTRADALVHCGLVPHDCFFGFSLWSEACRVIFLPTGVVHVHEIPRSISVFCAAMKSMLQSQDHALERLLSGDLEVARVTQATNDVGWAGRYSHASP